VTNLCTLIPDVLETEIIIFELVESLQILHGLAQETWLLRNNGVRPSSATMHYSKIISFI
jgi:hypothetical protein